jgi:hypothetical protein
MAAREREVEPPAQLVETTEVHDPAAVQHGRAVRERLRLSGIMRHVERRRAPLVEELAEQVEQLLLKGDVQVRERLLEEDGARLDGQGTGDGDALPLAAGELRGLAAVLPG